MSDPTKRSLPNSRVENDITKHRIGDASENLDRLGPVLDGLLTETKLLWRKVGGVPVATKAALTAIAKADLATALASDSSLGVLTVLVLDDGSGTPREFRWAPDSSALADSDTLATDEGGTGRWFALAADASEITATTKRQWLDDVATTLYLGSRTIAQINGLTPSAGDSVVASSAGTPTAGASDALVAGDVAEYDGTQWKKIVSASGGFVPVGTFLLVSSSTLFAPLTDVTDRNKVARFNGTSNTPTLASPADGDVHLVKGDGSIRENRAYSFNSGTGWVQSSGPVPYGSATPAPVGTAAAGSSAYVSRADHAHAHGDQLGGSLHAAAVAGVSDGFMTAAMAASLDAIPGTVTTAQNAANAAQADATTALANAATADAKAVTADGKAVTADGKAVAAQADATTALANAATADAKAVTADGKAVTADGKAVAAQADATTALANAATAQSTANAALPKSLYDAQSVVVAVADDTPIVQLLGDSEFVGRPTGGNVGNVTAAQARTILGTTIVGSGRVAADSTKTENGTDPAVETDFTGLSLPSAKINVARRTVRWRAACLQTDQNAADTTRIRAYFGTILLVDSTALAATPGTGTFIEGVIQMVGTGAAADFRSFTKLYEETTPSTIRTFKGQPGVDKVDATANVPLKLTVQHSTNNVANSTTQWFLEAELFEA